MSEGAKTNGFNKEKVKKAVKDWSALQAAFEEEVAKLRDDLGEGKDGILERMETLGIQRTVFKAMIKEMELREKADKIRDRFAED
jgi:hypothetical protein